MASGTSQPSTFVPRVVFPLFIVLAVSAVTYFGLRQCDCDDKVASSTSVAPASTDKPAH
ncbi:MAG: hypothetical protein ACOVSW_06505 [Candidatus Kapaibacteriota bacterium]